MLTISIALAIFTMIVALSGNQTETSPSGSLPNQESSPSIENHTVQSDFDWLKGGTLHNSTVLEWKNGSYENKLATAADWLASTIWKNHLNSASDFDVLKEKT
ncbi:hypothetical protein IQE94_00790 [Synechocystis sp. PCC 7339]|uniref:hypothetical protein n=1 Tax=Synechocystis sp. PCC 7339 TaxID=2782213 RepID=UPI001CC164DB|nr:hypothetical protein [Synechocystis sp. PCC 7339]UAJ72935.1 hypothetical protein IQE94_00790 [Synechocystis sp. PCC 7339]